MRDAHRERRGLGHDRRIGRDLLGHGLGADARVLLVADRDDHDVARELELRGSCACPECRRRSALHVERAAAVESVALDARLERAVVAVVPDRVRVAVQEQRAPASAPARDADHIRASRCHLVDVRLDARVLEPGRDEAGDLELARPARHEVGVDGVDRDELGHELAQRHQTPPSATVMACPLTPLARGLQRKAMTSATSSGASTRPSG